MTRTGQAAEEWALAEARQHSRNWTRLCKMFTRMAFAVPSDGTPDAGGAWDRAKYKHVTSDPLTIPEVVPVFWETSSVADHVAVGIGQGMCVSTDWPRAGDVGVAAIADITRLWGATLLGWTEDIDGVRVWSPPAPPAPEQNRVERARHEVHQAIVLLERAEPGRGAEVTEMKRALRRALRNGPKS